MDLDHLSQVELIWVAYLLRYFCYRRLVLGVQWSTLVSDHMTFGTCDLDMKTEITAPG
jgi:hypothetical protein